MNEHFQETSTMEEHRAVPYWLYRACSVERRELWEDIRPNTWLEKYRRNIPEKGLRRSPENGTRLV